MAAQWSEITEHEAIWWVQRRTYDHLNLKSALAAHDVTVLKVIVRLRRLVTSLLAKLAGLVQSQITWSVVQSMNHKP